MEELVIIKDPESIKLLMDPTRQKILNLLRIRNMSISELAKVLEKDPSTIFRHVKKLQERNLVSVAGERTIKNSSEKIYKRNASTYVLSPETFLKNKILVVEKRGMYGELRLALEEIGYKVTNPDIFDNFFINIESKVVEEVGKHKQDLDWNLLRNMYSTLFLLLSTQEEFEYFKNLFVKKEL